MTNTAQNGGGAVCSLYPGSEGWKIWRLAIRNLALSPQLGGIPSELATLNLTQYRQILSGKNRDIYEVRQDAVYVHLIVDARRDLKKVLMQRLLR